MTYFNFKKRPPKIHDNLKLIAQIDSLLSEVVRLTDMDADGNCTCKTCGAKDHWTLMQCGHFIPRAHMATRFDLKNVNVQCSTCNCMCDGNEEIHSNHIDQIHGEGTAYKLRVKSHEEVKFMAHELEGMKKELQAELKALKLEKFG
jgi:hypothetical protein